MASNNKRKKPKRKAGLVALMILLIILIIFAALAVFVSKRFAPTKAETDLVKYYNLSGSTSLDLEPAANDEIALVFQDEILTSRAVVENGEVFIPYKLIYDNIDTKFYVDTLEDVLIYTTATEFIASDIGESVYTINGTEHNDGYKIAMYRGDTLYVNLKFLDKYSSAQYAVYENPTRVCVWYQAGTFNYVTAKYDTYIRTKGGIKAEVVTRVESGTKLKVLEDLEDWLEVIDETGYRGYVQTKTVSEVFTEEVASDYQEPEYTHLSFGEAVNLVWDQVRYEYENDELQYRTENVTGINAISPTWYSFSDEYGYLASTASASYVEYAHEQGWKVLPLIRDFDTASEISIADILKHTSRRKIAVDNIIAAIKEIGADGINVDFEAIPVDCSDDYIQFIRELSIKCRENKLYLTVDNYAPYNFNAHYQISEQSEVCDYVIVMAYDDYVGTNESGPNAGLPFLKEVLGLCQDQVDMSRLVVGIPFYSRVWYEYTDGTLGYDNYTMNGIRDVINNNGVQTNWVEEIGYDYFTYNRYDGVARGWYENEKSIEAKIELIKGYNVAGTAEWVLGQERSEVWEVLEKFSK